MQTMLRGTTPSLSKNIANKSLEKNSRLNIVPVGVLYDLAATTFALLPQPTDKKMAGFDALTVEHHGLLGVNRT